MIQKKFLCKDIASAEDAIRQIGDITQQTPHKCALVTFYEAGLCTQDVDLLIHALRNSKVPGLLVAGISITMIAELMPEGTGVLLNLILTEEADIEVVSVPCIPGKESEAADKLRSRLDASDAPKAVEFFISNMSLNTTAIMENAMKGHEDVVLFGTSTIRNLPTKISVDESEYVVELEKMESETKEVYVFGDRIFCDGVVAVIFAGKNLKVKAEYALGWNPIGRKFSAELGDDPRTGETVINAINGRPAVDIYREYLGVYPDAYLISNICEFPLVVERDGINICMIPLDCGKDGELYFMMTVHEGERLRFTFASHDEVLNSSRRSLESMEHFRPEALFLTLCGNRINFLKEDAHIEWDSFGPLAPDYVVMHGACELYYHNKKGGILNSAHLAVGLREGEGSGLEKRYEHAQLEDLRRGRVMSLSDRMSVFLSTITKELMDTAAKAKAADEAKTAFLSHMSHEIRTPINAVLGMDELILRESEEPETLDYAENIRSAAVNLLGIVNDILDFSRIEAGRMSIITDEYELSAMVNDLYNTVHLRAVDKGLRVELVIDPMLPVALIGDETRIRQIISNLLTNAVKYTESGTVTLSMKRIASGSAADADKLRKACPGYTPDKDSVRIRISVSDTGIGIRPEDMERLFDEYERVEEGRNHSVEGTGLGLSISTELLELMGSRLSVESTYGKGSTFSFEILQGVADSRPVGNLDGKRELPTGPKEHKSFRTKGAALLVVDDSPVNLKLIRKLLQDTKIRIDTVESGEEALRMVQEHAYDVILLDHLMPGMDGPETLRRMKETEDNRSAGAAVISLTANALPGAKESYLAQGYNDYLSKPIIVSELENMLKYYIPSEKIEDEG